MTNYFSLRGQFFRPFQSFIILLSFIINTFGPIPMANANDFYLPAPGVMVQISPEFNPPILKGIKVYPNNSFQFDFILDTGDDMSLRGGSLATKQSLKEESTKLIKYFLASLTIPEKDLWVNLSPYEKYRIIPNSFGLTEMGRDLLAEDYMLKQITASLIYPEGDVGKKFWKRIYEEAAMKFGTTNIPVNTFNKVWIIPEKAVVYENGKAGTAYVVESKLKVMLEQDYLSLQKHEGIRSQVQTQVKTANQLGSQIVREIVIPELTKEVNENKNFAQLRQVYNSLILAAWYKQKIKDSILSQVYLDKNKVAGVSIGDPQEKQRIYERYVQAFKKGVFNYIKEISPDFESKKLGLIPMKYFSGGCDLAMNSAHRTALGLPAHALEKTNVLPRVLGLEHDILIQTIVQPQDMAMNAKSGLTSAEQKEDFLKLLQEPLKTISDPEYIKLHEMVKKAFDRVLSQFPDSHPDREIMARKITYYYPPGLGKPDPQNILLIVDRLINLSKSNPEVFSTLDEYKRALDQFNMAPALKRFMTNPSQVLSIFAIDREYVQGVAERSSEIVAKPVSRPNTFDEVVVLAVQMLREGYLEGIEVLTKIGSRSPIMRKLYMTQEYAQRLIRPIYEDIFSNEYFLGDWNFFALLANACEPIRPQVLTAMMILLNDPNVQQEGKLIVLNNLKLILQNSPSVYTEATMVELKNLFNIEPVIAMEGMRSLMFISKDQSLRNRVLTAIEELAKSGNEAAISTFINSIQLFPQMINENRLTLLDQLRQDEKLKSVVIGALAAVLNVPEVSKGIKQKINLSDNDLVSVLDDTSVNTISRQHAKLLFIRRSLQSTIRIEIALDSPIRTVDELMAAIRTVAEPIRNLMEYAKANTSSEGQNNNLPLRLADTIYDHLTHAANLGEFQVELKRYEEFHMMRVANWPKDVREELMKNRLLLSQGLLHLDTRPRVFDIIAESDHNGALMQNESLVRDFMRHSYLVLYEEIRNPDHYGAIVNKFAESETGNSKPALFHIFPFHSSSTGGILGRTSAAAENITLKYANRLNSQKLYETLLPEGVVILAGCEAAGNAQILSTEHNLAEMFAQAYAGRMVFAAEGKIATVELLKISGKVKFYFKDQRGKNVSVWQSGGHQQDYFELEQSYIPENEDSIEGALKLRQGRYILTDNFGSDLDLLNFIATRGLEVESLFRAKESSRFNAVLEIYKNQAKKPVTIDISANLRYFSEFYLNTFGSAHAERLLVPGNIYIPIANINESFSLERLFWREEHYRLMALINSSRGRLRKPHLLKETDALEKSYNEMLKFSESIKMKDIKIDLEDAEKFSNLRDWLLQKMMGTYGTGFKYQDFWVLLADDDPDNQERHWVQMFFEIVLKQAKNKRILTSSEWEKALELAKQHRQFVYSYVEEDMSAIKAKKVDIENISAPENNAMSAHEVNKDGGIDFTINKAQVVLDNSGDKIKFKMDPAMLRKLRDALGFVPVVIRFQPLRDLRGFLVGVI